MWFLWTLLLLLFSSIGTEPIECEDKEIQFAFGDETELFNITACIQKRRSSGNESKQEHGISLLEEAGVLKLSKIKKSLGSEGASASTEGDADVTDECKQFVVDYKM